MGGHCNAFIYLETATKKEMFSIHFGVELEHIFIFVI